MKNTNIEKTFFLVDDDKDDQQIFIEAIQSIGNFINCTTASNGLEALEKLRSELIILPDYIFLDLNMPLMGGKECLIEIKKDKQLKSIPTIIYSTSASRKDIQDAQQLGAFFLQKPNKFNDLVQDLLTILSGKLNNNKI